MSRKRNQCCEVAVAEEREALKALLMKLGEELYQNGKRLEELEGKYSSDGEARCRQWAGQELRAAAQIMDLDDRSKMLDDFVADVKRRLGEDDGNG